MIKSQIKIVFLGTPEFGAVVLEKLIRGGYPPALVVTEPDKPVGRKHVVTPSPVKIVAQKYDISVLQPADINNLTSKLKDLKPDLIATAAYGQMIPKEILKIPKFGCLNVHPSLLPKYRGPSPIQYTILNRDLITGVSIILVDEKMDHGPIVAFSNFRISDLEISCTALRDKLAELGGYLLLDVLPKWIRGEIKPSPQDESGATYTKILSRKDGRIDWAKSAAEIERQIRAFNPWPGSFTHVMNKRSEIKNIKIWKAGIQEQTERGPFGQPGKVYLATNEKIAVQTGKDFLIIEELQPESGRRMSSADFLKGRSDFIGTILQ